MYTHMHALQKQVEKSYQKPSIRRDFSKESSPFLLLPVDVIGRKKVLVVLKKEEEGES
jgi:hypothetical protein